MYLNWPRVSAVCLVMLALLNSILVIGGGPKSKVPSQRQQTGGEPQGRILNGEDAKQEDWRFIVSIGSMVNGTYDKFCGGVIWNEEFVLTAAHCLVDKNVNFTLDQLLIIIAQTDLSTLNETNHFFAQSYTSYVGYTKETKIHDIALIRLKEKIDLKGKNSNADCVCNPERVEVGGRSDVNLKGCVVAGWGMTSAPFQNLGEPKPEKLQQVGYMTVARESYCKEQSTTGRYNPQWHLCTHRKMFGRPVFYGPCSGDSGGPILCPAHHSDARILVGIVAYGEGPFCWGASYYTHIWNHMDWILSVTGETNETPSGATFRSLFSGFAILVAIVAVGGTIGFTLAQLEGKKNEVDPEISNQTSTPTVEKKETDDKPHVVSLK